MRYHSRDQLAMIARLQEEAAAFAAEAVRKLKEADELTKEVRETYGTRFVCDGKAYKLVHAAIGYGMPGNRDWLSADNDVRVVQ
jgi:hypothetical protein